MSDFTGRVDDIHRKLTRKDKPSSQMEQLKITRNFIEAFQNKTTQQTKKNQELLSNVQYRINKVIKNVPSYSQLQQFTQQKYIAVIDIFKDAVQQFTQAKEKADGKAIKLKSTIEIDLEYKKQNHLNEIKEHQQNIKKLVQVLKKEVFTLNNICEDQKCELKNLLEIREEQQKNSEKQKRALIQYRGKMLMQRVECFKKQILNDLSTYNISAKQKDKKNEQLIEALLQIY